MPFRTFRIGVGHIVARRYGFLFHGVGVAVFQGVITLRAIRVDIRPVVIRREGDALRRPRRVLYAVFIASNFNRNGLMVDICLLLTVCILPHLADGDLLGGVLNMHQFCLIGCNKTDIRFRHFSITYCRIRFFLSLVCIQHQEIVGRAVADVTVGGRGLFELVEHASVDIYNIFFHLIRVPEQDLAVCICRVVTIGLTPLAAVPMGQFERCTRQSVIEFVSFDLVHLQCVGIVLRYTASSTTVLVHQLRRCFAVSEHVNCILDLVLRTICNIVGYNELVSIL